VPIYPDEFS